MWDTENSFSRRSRINSSLLSCMAGSFAFGRRFNTVHFCMLSTSTVRLFFANKPRLENYFCCGQMNTRRVNDIVSQCIQTYCSGKLFRARLLCIVKNCNRSTLWQRWVKPGELCCCSLTAKLACDRLRRLVIDIHTFIRYLSVIKTTYYNVLFAAVSNGPAWYFSCVFSLPIFRDCYHNSRQVAKLSLG